MPFTKGHSGNPGGRPPKSRALTDLLAARGGHKVEIGGKNIPGRQLLARLLWEIATTGKATFPDGTMLEVGPRDWLETVKWLYAHIDGPPPKPEPEPPEDEPTGERKVTVRYASSEEAEQEESEESGHRADSSGAAQSPAADQQ